MKIHYVTLGEEQRRSKRGAGGRAGAGEQEALAREHWLVFIVHSVLDRGGTYNVSSICRLDQIRPDPCRLDQIRPDPNQTKLT